MTEAGADEPDPPAVDAIAVTVVAGTVTVVVGQTEDESEEAGDCCAAERVVRGRTAVKGAVLDWDPPAPAPPP